jgi:hypothetical protein
MGVIEGNEPVTDNEWETIKGGGDPAVERWIAGQMKGRSCAVVLVGSQTANRPWVKYEIKKAWVDGLGVVGIRIHGLKNRKESTSTAGANPFDAWKIGDTSMSQIVTLFSPTGAESKAVYSSICNNLDSLVEKAIQIRAKY